MGTSSYRQTQQGPIKEYICSYQDFIALSVSRVPDADDCIVEFTVEDP